MNNLTLLNDLKAIQAKHHYPALEDIINKLARELIQDECPHLITYRRNDSCHYGEYEQTVCSTCKKIISTFNNW
jgi:hypothetical protein